MLQFADSTVAFDLAKVAILPVAYDGTSTWIKGADKGPQAILEASHYLELYDIETNSNPSKLGFHTLPILQPPLEPISMRKMVTDAVAQLLETNKFVAMIGGEHSITPAAVHAHVQKWPALSVLHIDAHADLRQSYEGSPLNHACVMARVKEMCPIVQVGIRSLSEEELPATKDHPIFFAHNLQGQTAWIDQVVADLSSPVYVTIDLDAFDPSVIPSTGTPEPGGLDWAAMMRLLRAVAQHQQVVGCDVVELCPLPHDHASPFTAAKLLYAFLAAVFSPAACEDSLCR